jgi:hypothetical protein
MSLINQSFNTLCEVPSEDYAKVQCRWLRKLPKLYAWGCEFSADEFRKLKYISVNVLVTSPAPLR